MNYTDEKILKERERIKKDIYTSLEEGVYLKGRVMKFQRREIEKFFSVMLPNAFKIMPQKMAQVKYPSVFRPQRIYTTGDLSVNIGFSVFPDNLETSGTENTAKRMIETLIRDNPSYCFYETQNLSQRNGTWFSFRSHAIDCDLYNMILISKISSGILQSNFNCLHVEKDEWETVILQIWESILNNEEGNKL